MRIFIAFVLVCFPDVCSLFAQQVSVKGAAIPEYPYNIYKEATRTSQNLYNGRRYFLYDPLSEEHQFYIDRKWITGSVFFDGQQFDSVALLYDIHKEEVVLKDLHNNFMLLPVERVKSFDINQHHFERLISGDDIPSYMKTGFYDVLYNGNSRVMVHRKKDRQEKIADMKIIPIYEIKDSYYIFRHNTYWSVRTKKSVLTLFPGYEREMKRGLRKQKIRYRKNRELAITEMVKHYDEISK